MTSSFLWLSSNLKMAIAFMLDFTASFTHIPHSDRVQLQHYANLKAFFNKLQITAKSQAADEWKDSPRKKINTVPFRSTGWNEATHGT